MYVNNGHKTHVQEINVSKVERKEKDTYKPHYIPQYQLSLTKISYTNPPSKYDYSHIQNYSSFLSRVTEGKYIK